MRWHNTLHGAIFAGGSIRCEISAGRRMRIFDASTTAGLEVRWAD